MFLKKTNIPPQKKKKKKKKIACENFISRHRNSCSKKDFTIGLIRCGLYGSDFEIWIPICYTSIFQQPRTMHTAYSSRLLYKNGLTIAVAYGVSISLSVISHDENGANAWKYYYSLYIGPIHMSSG